MSRVKRALVAAAVMVVGMVGFAAPAFAAGSYGGAGSTFQASQWNVAYQGSLPSPPASVPSSSVITGVTYSLNWSSPGATPAGQNAYICDSTTCYTASRFTNSISSFNGENAKTTQLRFIVKWSNGFSSGTIAGGPITYTTSVTVNYS